MDIKAEHPACDPILIHTHTHTHTRTHTKPSTGRANLSCRYASSKSQLNRSPVRVVLGLVYSNTRSFSLVLELFYYWVSFTQILGLFPEHPAGDAIIQSFSNQPQKSIP